MNPTTREQFDRWLTRPEGVNLEFKKARHQFDGRHELQDYCAALANERGGKLILGVDDQTRKVVGTTAYHGTHQKLAHELLQNLGLKIEVEEVHHPDGRVLIFQIPSRPVGRAVRSKGHCHCPMRAGESLVEMDDETLRAIFREVDGDFTAQPVSGLTIAELDPKALENYRRRWAHKQQREEYLKYSDEKTLASIGARTDSGELNFAALILFGSAMALRNRYPDSEVVFEWRQEPRQTAYNDRKAWREGYLTMHDKIWEKVNSRNLIIPFQKGYFLPHLHPEIMAFNEKAIREAVVNAIGHRDYTFTGQSVFILASPEGILVESPGGFLEGVTPENILRMRKLRNRTLMEILERPKLVERSGQGMDDVFENSIREGKGVPDLSASDRQMVRLTVPARVQDHGFIEYLETIANEKKITLTVEELLELETIRTKQRTSIPSFRKKFLELGIIERVGRTRGARYILAYHYYKATGQSGVHTRLTGLSREQVKTLILNHLAKNRRGKMREFFQAIIGRSQKEIRNILQELRLEGKIIFCGTKRSGYWELTGK